MGYLGDTDEINKQLNLLNSMETNSANNYKQTKVVIKLLEIKWGDLSAVSTYVD